MPAPSYLHEEVVSETNDDVEYEPASLSMNLLAIECAVVKGAEEIAHGKIVQLNSTRRRHRWMTEANSGIDTRLLRSITSRYYTVNNV